VTSSPSKKTRSSPADKATYHHGELADRLMELAIAAIETDGTESLSLRALARLAGVSATAPYRHFPSKRCLLAGLATRGFTQLTQQIAAELTADRTSDDRFIAMGLAYVNFAVQNPVPYKLMFGSVIADFSDYDMLQRAAKESYDQLLDELGKLIEAHELDISAVELGGIVWSGVHGMASLMINNMGNPAIPTKAGSKKTSPSDPGQSIMGLHQNTERAMRVLFGNLIGDNAGLD